tara:strand:- start:804 stop:1199 length:396 start_codon:yes stop_codon:yes gene_type:complete
MKLELQYDKIGIISSTLCMIHCIGTPFLFIAKSCSPTCCSDAPTWWLMIDYLFLVISFFAIFHTTNSSTSLWLRILFWITWSILFFSIVDHTFNYNIFPKNFTYFPGLTIVALHFYNLKINKCENKNCEIC